jgi:hypothetical protein
LDLLLAHSLLDIFAVHYFEEVQCNHGAFWGMGGENMGSEQFIDLWADGEAAEQEERGWGTVHYYADEVWEAVAAV